MKTLLYFALGIMLGIVTISFGLNVLKDAFTLNIISALINGVITYALGHLTMKCFDKI